MTKAEKEVLRNIMDDLKAGFSFGKDKTWDYYNNRPFPYPYFDDRLYIFRSSYNGKKYIGWCHYGSSANAVTLRDLEWIITVIFKTTPSEFLKEYIRNDKSTITY